MSLCCSSDHCRALQQCNPALPYTDSLTHPTHCSSAEALVAPRLPAPFKGLVLCRCPDYEFQILNDRAPSPEAVACVTCSAPPPRPPPSPGPPPPLPAVIAAPPPPDYAVPKPPACGSTLTLRAAPHLAAGTKTSRTCIIPASRQKLVFVLKYLAHPTQTPRVIASTLKLAGV